MSDMQRDQNHQPDEHDEHQTAPDENSAASAGAESPVEGEAAMDDAEDAVVNDPDDS